MERDTQYFIAGTAVILFLSLCILTYIFSQSFLRNAPQRVQISLEIPEQKTSSKENNAIQNA